MSRRMNGSFPTIIINYLTDILTLITENERTEVLTVALRTVPRRARYAKPWHIFSVATVVHRSRLISYMYIDIRFSKSQCLTGPDNSKCEIE